MTLSGHIMLTSLYNQDPIYSYNMGQRTKKSTIRLVRPRKTQISLRIRAILSESSLIAPAIYSLQAFQRTVSTAATTQQKVQAPTQQNVPVTAQHNVPATIRQNVPVPTLQNVQATTVPQNIPVRITKRNQPSKRLPMRNNFNTALQRSNGNLSFSKAKRTWLIGDSILKGVNTKAWQVMWKTVQKVERL